MITKGFVRKCESVAMFAGWLDAANQPALQLLALQSTSIAINKYCYQQALRRTFATSLQPCSIATSSATNIATSISTN
jgi:hypothetical protein